MTPCPRCGSYGHDLCEDVPQLPTFQSLASDAPRTDRRRARQLELLVVGLVLAAVFYVVVIAKPADATASYTHISACKQSLGGYRSDNDVRYWRTKTLAKRFIGFDVGGWHGRDGSAYVVGIFEFSYGWHRWTARCGGGDFRYDSFGR